MRPSLLVASLLSACTTGVVADLEPDQPEGDSVTDTAQLDPVTPLSGYSWVLDDSLAGMPLPGSREPLDNDLHFLASQGLDLLVSLTETPLDPEQVSAHGMDPLHIPIEDFTAPEQDQIDLFVDELGHRLGHGDRVGVHCHGGLGRTGTMLSTWFVVQGMTADDAMAHVRGLRPGSIETEEQEDAVRRFEERLRPDTP